MAVPSVSNPTWNISQFQQIQISEQSSTIVLCNKGIISIRSMSWTTSFFNKISGQTNGETKVPFLHQLLWFQLSWCTCTLASGDLCIAGRTFLQLPTLSQLAPAVANRPAPQHSLNTLDLLWIHSACNIQNNYTTKPDPQWKHSLASQCTQSGCPTTRMGDLEEEFWLYDHQNSKILVQGLQLQHGHPT